MNRYPKHALHLSSLRYGKYYKRGWTVNLGLKDETFDATLSLENDHEGLSKLQILEHQIATDNLLAVAKQRMYLVRHYLLALHIL